MNNRTIFIFLLSLALSGCFTGSDSSDAVAKDDTDTTTENPAAESGDSEAGEDASPVNNDDLVFGTMSNITADRKDNIVPYVPPQCYTDPVSENGDIHNPCYACHTESKRPNFLNDVDVQLEYGFPDTALKNNWSNVYKDRTAAVAAISDEEILNYVREDNYKTADGRIILAEKLHNVPASWDRDSNGSWDGYIPDLYMDFDENGFDKDPQGGYTGWRVFAYYPFLGTFMPTNGSTDDVMIRLPPAFRELSEGQFDVETYMVNMAVVEAMMKEKDITINEVDENRYGVDLDKNGVLGKTTTIKYEWAPLNNVYMHYVGQAGVLADSGKIKMAARLFPTGTEFIHSVRYIDVDADGRTKMAARMKELRYSRKHGWRDYYALRNIVDDELKERHDFPGRVKEIVGNMETGLFQKQGWTYQGFIEDDAGQLRPQSYEETYFCMGCHGYIGASNDTVISFNRKLDHGSFRNSWYHWLEKDLSGIADPAREDGQGEYAYYLEQNPTGNEYRNNDEVLNKFFDADGHKKPEAFNKLESDISYLLMPSAERALMLNKAYKVIVDEQSFDEGREGVVKPLNAIHHEVELDQPTGVKDVLSYY
ncbi:MAG: hypothetical protein CMI03_12215 [Oceanospirillaceae bacterium]|uniref:hypothetical protein n=1 Tax=unclassified Thalassolituus TaxID=2624967 RepID=UPI000C4D0A7C|nr:MULTISPECIES: hypothetical protein [unclassified Thalassolituus]MAS24564.1 hypothetical protein [Oceanospirillaceae bacterium]MBL33751.1 hypothetical protein [Oceanospirillaceae bacterium]MBS53499.1 hypothetical protein [Oceanospirillaceae bacterium]|tara:strand:+ start:9887 stop:11668 length:1782 start_codon:yes stop_codon:yes gene_type:complete